MSSRGARPAPIHLALSLAGALAAASLGCAPEDPSEPATPASEARPTRDEADRLARPDVLLVVLDTLRADRSSAYGYARPTTPAIERLARNGVLFEDVTAPGSWTLPSHASLFTGETPRVHGAHLVGGETASTTFSGMHFSTLDPRLPTLAERFRAAGYRTSAVVSNGWLSPELGLMRGFDDVQSFVKDSRTLDAVLALLDEPTEEPLFLFVNIMAAHSPYHDGQGIWSTGRSELLLPESAPDWLRPFLKQGRIPGVQLARMTPAGGDVISAYLSGRIQIPPDGFDFLAALYDAGVKDADAIFSVVLERWARERPLSVVAVTSDHGEALGEHGLLEHRGSVYSEVVKVPLVVASPSRLPRGARIATPSQLQDLHATLLALAGLAPRAESRQLRALDGAPSDAPIVASAWPVRGWARSLGGRYAKTWHLYRVGDDALVWSEDDEGESAELFDLASDPGMLRDLSAERGVRRGELLRAAREAWSSERESGVHAVTVSDALRAELQALGYDAGESPATKP